MSLKLKVIIWIIVAVCLAFSIAMPLDHDPERSFFDSLFGSKKEVVEKDYAEKHVSYAEKISQTF